MKNPLGASLLLVAIAGSARASAALPLVVLPDADPPPASVTRALGRSGRRLSRAEALRALPEARARLRLARARRAAEAGRRAVVKLRLEPAKSALREALGLFADAQLLPEACRGAHDAARELSFLHWQRQDLAPARRWRAAASHLAATAIDPTRYPPEFVAFWSASDENPAAITITVTVAVKRPAGGAEGSAPAASEAWVNCKAVGRTPAAVSVEGAALVALVRGARTASLVIEPDRSELVELALAPAATELSAEDAAALLQATGAPALLWVRRDDRGSWAIDRFAPASGWQRPYRRVSPAPAPPAVRVARKRDEPAAAGPSTVLGWALTGAATAAIVTGVVSAVLADSAADEIERKAAAGEVFDPADEDDNRRFRTVSYTTLAVGGALAAGAVVFWLWRARHQDAPPSAAGLQVRGTGLLVRW